MKFKKGQLVAILHMHPLDNHGELEIGVITGTRTYENNTLHKVYKQRTGSYSWVHEYYVKDITNSEEKP